MARRFGYIVACSLLSSRERSASHQHAFALGYLSTHVLDLVTGHPAVGMRLRLAKVVDGALHYLTDTVTNHDGRVDTPLLDGDAFVVGVYQLEFHVGRYFAGAAAGGETAPSFLDIVPLRFGVSDVTSHYHVPLLVTPWAYSTYRGS